MDGVHIVCPSCDSVNRVPENRPAAQAVCGRCKTKLLEGRPIDLDGARFERHAERNDIPVIADFWAPWCGPCRAMAPVFERAARELEPSARFVKVNVDENPDLAGNLGVRGIPALFVLRHGRVLAQQAGVADFGTLRNWVTQFAASAPR